MGGRRGGARSSGVGQPRALICAALPVIVPLGYLRRLDCRASRPFWWCSPCYSSSSPSSSSPPSPRRSSTRAPSRRSGAASTATPSTPPPPHMRRRRRRRRAAAPPATRDGRHTLGAAHLLYASRQINVPSIVELRVPTRPRMWRVRRRHRAHDDVLPPRRRRRVRDVWVARRRRPPRLAPARRDRCARRGCLRRRARTRWCRTPSPAPPGR